MVLTSEDPPESHESLAQAHGILCALAVAVIFPVGAILLRFSTRYPVSVHKWTQLLGCTTYLAGFIAAILLWAHLADSSEWSLGRHGALGLTVSICVLLQAVLGLWNHRRYQMQYGRIAEGQAAVPPKMMATAWLHILLGWFIVLAGLVNAGLGISKSAREGQGPSAWTIPYSTVAGIMGASLCIAMSWSWIRRSRQRAAEADTELQTDQERVQLREAHGAVRLR